MKILSSSILGLILAFSLGVSVRSVWAQALEPQSEWKDLLGCYETLSMNDKEVVAPARYLLDPGFFKEQPLFKDPRTHESISSLNFRLYDGLYKAPNGKVGQRFSNISLFLDRGTFGWQDGRGSYDFAGPVLLGKTKFSLLLHAEIQPDESTHDFILNTHRVFDDHVQPALVYDVKYELRSIPCSAEVTGN